MDGARGAAILRALQAWIAHGKPENRPVDAMGLWTPEGYRLLYRASRAGREAYYRSQHWLKKRNEQRVARPVCEICNVGPEIFRLEVHHLDTGYARIGDERPCLDLQTLCYI